VIGIVMPFFGAKKIPQLVRSFGRFSAEFLKRMKDQTDISNIVRGTIADALGIDYGNKNDEELRNAINKEGVRERK
jgi:sec-independent protein translocase protein TatA